MALTNTSGHITGASDALGVEVDVNMDDLSPAEAKRMRTLLENIHKDKQPAARAHTMRTEAEKFTAHIKSTHRKALEAGHTAGTAAVMSHWQATNNTRMLQRYTEEALPVVGASAQLQDQPAFMQRLLATDEHAIYVAAYQPAYTAYIHAARDALTPTPKHTTTEGTTDMKHNGQTIERAEITAEDRAADQAKAERIMAEKKAAKAAAEQDTAPEKEKDMNNKAPRKRTKKHLCDAHNGGALGRGDRVLEMLTEGGPAWGPACVGGPCRLWPGTDKFYVDACYEEMDLPWTRKTQAEFDAARAEDQAEGEARRAARQATQPEQEALTSARSDANKAIKGSKAAAKAQDALAEAQQAYRAAFDAAYEAALNGTPAEVVAEDTTTEQPKPAAVKPEQQAKPVCHWCGASDCMAVPCPAKPEQPVTKGKALAEQMREAGIKITPETWAAAKAGTLDWQAAAEQRADRLTKADRKAMNKMLADALKAQGFKATGPDWEAAKAGTLAGFTAPAQA